MSTATDEVARGDAAPENRRAVLTKAVVRASQLLGISQSCVARSLGVSESTASRMFAGNYLLEPGRKEWELAALFVRMFRSLDSLVGKDDAARAWLTSDNQALGARPVDLIPHAEGLVRVVFYLDAARGRVLDEAPWTSRCGFSP